MDASAPRGARRPAGRICVAALAALATGCGGSSPPPGAAKLEPGDVALVGRTHITTGDLRHQIRIEVRAMRLGVESCTGGSRGAENCTVEKRPVPRVGTAAYRTDVVEPVVTYLVTDAELHDLARRLSVVVTPRDVRTQIAANVRKLYGDDEARYRADLRTRGLTDRDVAQQVELSLIQRRIDAKLRAQVTVTPGDVRRYFDTHRSLYETDQATRRVEFVLLASRAAAVRARAAIAGGRSFAAVAGRAIDDSTRHGRFVATKGQLDAAFQRAAFGLRTNALSRPVAVDRAYARASLRGRCKRVCYYVIRPLARTVPGGSEKPFAAVRAQIRSRLLSTLQLRHVQRVIARLDAAERRVTRYAPGYAPAPSTGAPDPEPG
jgi:PPIC-type PPIASE domain